MNSVIPAPLTDIPQVPVEVKHDEKARVLDGMVKRLRTFVAELQEEIKEKDFEIQRLQARVRKIHTSQDAQLAKDSEVMKKDVVIQGLKKRLRREERHSRNLSKRLVRIKQFAELSMDGEVLPVKVMDALTKEGLRRLIDDMGIEEGDIIFVTRLDGWGRTVVKDLAEINIKAVVCSSSVLAQSDPLILPVFREAKIPLISDTGFGSSGTRKTRTLRRRKHLKTLFCAGKTGQAQHERERNGRI